MRHFRVEYYIDIDSDDIEASDMDLHPYQAAITVTNSAFNQIWGKEATFMDNITKIIATTAK